MSGWPRNMRMRNCKWISICSQQIESWQTIGKRHPVGRRMSIRSKSFYGNSQIRTVQIHFTFQNMANDGFMRVLYVRMCSRSTPVDPDAFLICSNVFSLDPRRPKYVSHAFECALARCLSIQTTFLRAECHSRSTRVDQNTCLVCLNVLSLDACRSKRQFCVLDATLARHVSIQMHVLYV